MTVVFLAGGGGLLLLMQPPSRAAASMIGVRHWAPDRATRRNCAMGVEDAVMIAELLW
jgi:hypothetical protein